MLGVLNILEILSICNAVLLAFFLFAAKSENRKANLFLGLFLISLACEILFSYQAENVEIGFILPPTNLLTIVLLYFYVKFTVGDKITYWDKLFYIPVLFTIIYYYSGGEELFIFQLLEYGLNIFLLIQILGIQKKHLKNLKNFYSDLEHKSLSWIKWIAYAFLAFYALWITEDLIGLLRPAYISSFAGASIILTFFVIVWIAYTAFEYNEIFRITLSVEGNLPINDLENEKQYVTKSEKNGKKENDLLPIQKEKANEENKKQETSKSENELFVKIRILIVDKRLYANPKLNLRILAEQLNMKEKRLSGLINQYADMNFYNFINSLRIDEVKTLLNSPKGVQLSVLGIANEVGFSSKSTFYTAFKNIVGMTPTEFQLKKLSD